MKYLFFIHNEIQPVEGPKDTRGRELQSKGQNLWGYMRKIAVHPRHE